MIFWRITDNKVLPVQEVDTLGFEESEGMRIPDEYLQDQEFVIMRGCHGIGDYGIISAMPRLLKQKYPNCGVFLPSNNLYKKLWGRNNKVVESIFKNNPYVDGFVDSVKGDIFHDHYRVWDKNNPNIPLIKQMLKFWQFEDNEMEDYLPELYWTDEEKSIGDEIIKDFVGKDNFGCLMISDRFGQDDKTFKNKTFEEHSKKLNELLKHNNLPYFYWSHRPINELGFKFKKVLNFRHMNLRIQLYIKSKAMINVGIQCGTTQCIIRYSRCKTIQRQFPIGSNFLDGEELV